MKTDWRKMLLMMMCAAYTLHLQAQKFENLAQTPPMGWNSWNHFNWDIDEQKIREIADAMVSTGMRDAGYEYIVIDDFWQLEKRDSLEFIVPDPDKFPSGIKALADYIHSKGLKFGIYSCAGNKTCGGLPAGRGHEYQDAVMYARWGVDYLKYDWCNTNGLNAVGAYTTMSDALRAAGRPIVFSLCEWGHNKPWRWAEKVGHLWRTTMDIYNCFDCKHSGEDEAASGWEHLGVLQIIDLQDSLRRYAGPGHWNDPDMLEVGNGVLTDSENRLHFSMWAMLASPLMAGNDLRNMDKKTIEILTNKDVIAVNQDKLGVQALKYRDWGDLEVWFKPLAGGDWAVAFLNRGKEDAKVDFDWKANVFTDKEVSRLTFDPEKNDYRIIDLWTKKELKTTQKPLKTTVPAHDILMLRLKTK